MSKKITDQMVRDAVAMLDRANVPRKDRMFWIVLATPEDEQRYAELKGWA